LNYFLIKINLLWAFLEFSRRQANVVALELAGAAMYMANSQVLELMSNCIVDIFYNDMR
jgi:hypothetical protein